MVGVLDGGSDCLGVWVVYGDEGLLRVVDVDTPLSDVELTIGFVGILGEVEATTVFEWHSRVSDDLVEVFLRVDFDNHGLHLSQGQFLFDVFRDRNDVEDVFFILVEMDLGFSLDR